MNNLYFDIEKPVHKMYMTNSISQDICIIHFLHKQIFKNEKEFKIAMHLFFCVT